MAVIDSGLGPHRRRRYIPAKVAASVANDHLEEFDVEVDDEGQAGGDYDPAAFRIPEVVAYAEGLNLDELSNLIDLEEDGNSRSTLLKALKDLRKALEDDSTASDD